MTESDDSRLLVPVPCARSACGRRLDGAAGPGAKFIAQFSKQLHALIDTVYGGAVALARRLRLLRRDA